MRPWIELNRPPLVLTAEILVLGLFLAAMAHVAGVGDTAAPTPLQMSLDPIHLPRYALNSLLRMVAAYGVSLFVAFALAYAAASSRRVEAILTPTLDILQSIPILSYMPVVVLTLVSIFPGRLGQEMASIVLLVTCMVWNLIFTLYTSRTTISRELIEASRMLRLSSWMRFKYMEFPFAVVGLVWNSIVSWANGWFFLMASEMFQMGSRDFRLPGLGSYLQSAAERSDLRSMVYGVLAIFTLILILDQLVWRPLVFWAGRSQDTEDEQARRPWFSLLLSRSQLVSLLYERVLNPLGEALDDRLGRLREESTGIIQRLWKGLQWVLAMAAAFYVLSMLYRAALLLTAVSGEEWLALCYATVITVLRIAAAVTLVVAWTVPVGIAIGTNPRVTAFMQPIVQLMAGFPATAVLPILLLYVGHISGGVDLVAILLMMLGTQWYLLFNVIAGAQKIPTELRYATDMFRMTGFQRFRFLIGPAIFPQVVPGLVACVGGCWNATVIAERAQLGDKTFMTPGLGSAIAVALQAADYPRLLAATLMMIGVIILFNRLLWRRLYDLAEGRYRMD